MVLTPMNTRVRARESARFIDSLIERPTDIISFSSDAVIFIEKGVEVHTVSPASLHTQLTKQIQEFEPTWILVSADITNLLKIATEVEPKRVVYLCHGPSTLPFGPYSFVPNTRSAKLLRKVAGIITVSNFLKEYIRNWSGLDSIVIPFPVYGSGPFPTLGTYDNDFVTMINPCSVKGILIFLELARRLPQIQFAAIPTWGTTHTDLISLRKLPNMHILGAVDDIDEIFTRTKVLVVPSLWYEAFSLIVIEAMLRGIPVLASNVGGLPEAKLKVDYLLPVDPIEEYEDDLDEQMIPVPVIRTQDIIPWVAALEEITLDRERYKQLSKLSRDAALTFVEGVRIEAFEQFFQTLSPTSKNNTANASFHDCGQDQRPKMHTLSSALNNLSLEKRAHLANRLRKVQ